jgi:hypothetical protein
MAHQPAVANQLGQLPAAVSPYIDGGLIPATGRVTRRYRYRHLRHTGGQSNHNLSSRSRKLKTPPALFALQHAQSMLRRSLQVSFSCFQSF